MELVEATLSPVQRRAGAARVAWTDLAAQQRRRGEAVRVLAPGESVVLHVDRRSFHRGRVVGYLGTGSDGAYVVTVGAPVARPKSRIRIRTQAVATRVVPAQRGPVELFL